MRAGILLCGALLAVAAGTGTAAPTPAPPVPAPAAPAPPSAAEIEASRQAVAAADVPRLFRDHAYAEAMLVHLDRLLPLGDDNPDLGAAVDNIRLFALAGLDRPDDVRTAIDRTLARRPTQSGLYGGPWLGALAIHDYERAVVTVETASRNVPGLGWGDLRSLLAHDAVGQLLAELHSNHQEDKRVRLAQALFRIGWPGGDDAEAGDFVRSILTEDRIAHNDSAGATDYASGITTPSMLVPLMVRTRYDRAIAPGQDRLALINHALEERDRATAAAVAAAPANMQVVLDRAQYLRAIGRDAEAYAVLEPFTHDVRATIAAGDKGMWLINEAAYALSALGRDADALRLMERLGTLPVENNISLISAFINRNDIFLAARRYADALAWGQRLDRDYSRFASDYGKMWIAAGIVCALSGLNRSAEATPQLERLRTGSDANPAALTEAYLCVGDDAAAAALLVRRLDSDDPDSALVALQDYGIAGRRDGMAPWVDRLIALRERPAVRDALARVGRILPLPLSRSYLGGF